MPILTTKTSSSNLRALQTPVAHLHDRSLFRFSPFPSDDSSEKGFSLIEILVALVLAALIFLAVPSSDTVQKHRDLKTAVDDLDRSVRFAGNEAVLRNTVVRLRISLDKNPVEYTVEYGPAGNLPLPDMPVKASKSLQDEKAEADKRAALDRQFTKVEEFEEIKHEISPDVTILGMASTSQKELVKEGEATLYFYPTGEKDGGIIIFSTVEEIAYLEIAPFLSETTNVFEPLKTSGVAKLEDILQTKMEEVYKEWLAR
jgi:prepilin-type N-terminal cleavage/methylation domain-containing protein